MVRSIAQGPAEVAAHRAFLGCSIFRSSDFTAAEHSTTVSFYAVEGTVEKVGVHGNGATPAIAPFIGSGEQYGSESPGAPVQCCESLAL